MSPRNREHFLEFLSRGGGGVAQKFVKKNGAVSWREMNGENKYYFTLQ
jgi:hypothetical protein